jgi:hypothetical protein
MTGRIRHLAALLTAVAATVLVAIGGAAAVTRPQPLDQSGFALAQESYVAALSGRQDRAEPWTQMEDYVRGLVYWHRHPDWGVG